MPLDGATLLLSDLEDKYEEKASSRSYERLYDDAGRWAHMFAVLHEELNQHLAAINDRASTTRHYWAQNSKDFIALLKELKDDRYALRRAGFEIALADEYEEAIEQCQLWLSPSGGSTVPIDFTAVEIIRYEPIFRESGATVVLKKQAEQIKLKMVGSGSYANVYSYVDPDYGIKFSVKRAKKGSSERDLERFRREFEVMNRLSFPYVLEVYKFNESRNEYRMEFCDETLKEYISKRNGELNFSTRKRIAQQFLFGINYIHSQNLLHRDISLQNCARMVIWDRV